MKAVRFHQTGGPELLVLEDVPIPTPGSGEILIRVEATGINYADVMRRNGDPYPEPSPTPFVPGIEVAGTIRSPASIWALIGRRDLIRSTLEDLIGYVLDKRLELQVGAVLPLARASEAHRLLEGRKTTGKVVLQPWAEEV